MLQLAVFVIALIAVFAVKAFAIAKTQDALLSNSASFSWASLRPQDEAEAIADAAAEVARVEPVRVPMGTMRRAGGASA